MNGVLVAFWNLPVAEVLRQLQSSEKVLTWEDAQQRLQHVGPNLLHEREKATGLRLFANQFKSPIILILLFATGVSAVTHDWVDALIILAIVFGSALLSFVQEYRANTATEKLRAQLTTKVTVLRGSEAQSVPAEAIVPGDVVLLSAGSLVPAEKILAYVDGVMIARGDLGVETPLEDVPIIQKRIIRSARQSGKPVITATQMLRSMVSSPRPTRAEAADVANAILDGTDALMLSEETAMGAYPIEAVKVLDRIARATEPYLNEGDFLDERTSELLPMTPSSISRAACQMAEDLGAAAIVAGTSSGSTARLVARFRPACPVVGLTPKVLTQRQLTLSWGVIPALVAPFADTEEMFGLAGLWVLDQGLAQQGDCVIVTAGVPVGVPGTTNLVKVIEIK